MLAAAHLPEVGGSSFTARTPICNTLTNKIHIRLSVYILKNSQYKYARQLNAF